MPLSLKESNAIGELAKLFWSFLPGSGSSQWKGHVTFKSVATEVGVGDYWVPGSKENAIAGMLGRTLEHRRKYFEKLVLEIMRAGLIYRRKNGNPVMPDEVERINAQILALGFRFPDLWDTEFRDALRDETGERARQHLDDARAADRTRETAKSARREELDALKREFFTLESLADRSKAGLALEPILNRLFALSGLEPQAPFRVTGEQIDGSFELDNEVYLLEAKWHREPRPASELYIFRGKIEGKSRFTRGVFLSINGVSDDAADAITRGKESVFFVMNGYDLFRILEGSVSLVEFLRRRQRLLAERGRVAVPFAECGLV